MGIQTLLLIKERKKEKYICCFVIKRAKKHKKEKLYTYSRDVSTGATGAIAVAPKFSDTLTLFQPGGARFCPPLARSHLNLPCGYVPDTYVLVQIHKSYYILSTYILQPTYLHVGKSNNEKAQQMSFLSNTVQSTPILHMCI